MLADCAKAFDAYLNMVGGTASHTISLFCHCITYGWKMMTGFLASEGIRVSQLRVGLALKRVDPQRHSWRRNTVQQLTNPVPCILGRNSI